MNKLSLKGVLLGGIADIVATNIFVIPIAIYIAVSSDIIQFPKAQQQAAMLTALHASPILFASQLCIGFAGSVLGGYVAARLSGHDELLNGALSSWLCLASGIYGTVFGSVHDSALVQVAYFLASPAAGVLGGYFRLKQARGEVRP